MVGGKNGESHKRDKSPDVNFTKVPNGLLERQSRGGLSKRECQILSHVIRYTYGFHRKWHRTTYKAISSQIGMDKGNVATVVRQMVLAGILKNKRMVVVGGKIEIIHGIKTELAVNQSWWQLVVVE